MISPETESGPAELMSAGREALDRGAWDEARALFRAALGREQTPEALEGVGLASYWLDDAVATIGARERAYRLYRDRGDRCGAARVAVALADDACFFRGDAAVANGWLRRAHRLLAGLEPTVEHGLLASLEGYFALVQRHDAATARRLASEAAAYGRLLGVVDVEMLGLALEGLALVCEGAITEGMARLDEAAAAATSGEMRDPGAIGYAWCFLIFACEWVRDYERAAQWCERFEAFCTRWHTGSFLSVCRTHYAVVLIWRGAWAAAEAQLAFAIGAVATTRPPMVGDGLVRLAELRRRQGRWEEAEALVGQAAGHPAARLGLAALALDRDQWEGAAELLDRYLRQLAPAGRIERAAGLELLVRACAGCGDAAGAARALTELQAIAAVVGSEPLRASVALAEGVVAASVGDAETARRRFEDALDAFTRCGAAYDAALARVELTRCLQTLGRRAAAERELAAAIAALETIGASGWAARVRSLAEALRGSADSAPDPAGLSPREREVVGLLARGRSNAEIAEALVISLRTVERHISTIYEKLGARGRGARATATAYALRRGLIPPYV